MTDTITVAQLQLDRMDRLDQIALDLGRDKIGSMDILPATLENMESDVDTVEHIARTE